jgi:hypothetical protein
MPEFEIFYDIGYFDMWCVRCVDDRRFCSPLSFHFDKKEDAEEFIRLLRIAK